MVNAKDFLLPPPGYSIYKIPMFQALKKVMEYEKHTFRVTNIHHRLFPSNKVTGL